ncbi:MAG: hypothetical protein ACM3SY_12855 [Candidatus Omnitrophota bacterium]
MAECDLCLKVYSDTLRFVNDDLSEHLLTPVSIPAAQANRWSYN